MRVVFDSFPSPEKREEDVLLKDGGKKGKKAYGGWKWGAVQR